jgi:hypothetical protein
MRLGTAMDTMAVIGFDPVEVHYRDGVNTLMFALK